MLTNDFKNDEEFISENRTIIMKLYTFIPQDLTKREIFYFFNFSHTIKICSF